MMTWSRWTPPLTPPLKYEVDPFGQNVSKIVQQGSPWKTRHDRLEDLIVMLMQHSGMSAIGEPRNVVNGLIPRPLFFVCNTIYQIQLNI